MGKIRLFLIGLCVSVAGNNLMAQTTSAGAAAGSEISNTSLIVRSSPNSDYITLELAGGGKSSVPFEIFGLDGNEMYQGKISGTQLIEVSTWPSGTYFVICGSQREKMIVHK